jgi:hypothetical protein
MARAPRSLRLDRIRKRVRTRWMLGTPALVYSVEARARASSMRLRTPTPDAPFT